MSTATSNLASVEAEVTAIEQEMASLAAKQAAAKEALTQARDAVTREAVKVLAARLDEMPLADWFQAIVALMPAPAATPEAKQRRKAASANYKTWLAIRVGGTKDQGGKCWWYDHRKVDAVGQACFVLMDEPIQGNHRIYSDVATMDWVQAAKVCGDRYREAIQDRRTVGIPAICAEVAR